MDYEDIDEAATEWGLELIAKTAHEVNRAYCKSQGDDSIKSWDDSPYKEKVIAVNDVREISKNMDAKNILIKSNIANDYIYTALVKTLINELDINE
jgi:hypothetical protein